MRSLGYSLERPRPPSPVESADSSEAGGDGGSDAAAATSADGSDRSAAEAGGQQLQSAAQMLHEVQFNPSMASATKKHGYRGANWWKAVHVDNVRYSMVHAEIVTKGVNFMLML